jgi:pimeloyl-ACP methyl ester carboxylesterase
MKLLLLILAAAGSLTLAMSAASSPVSAEWSHVAHKTGVPLAQIVGPGSSPTGWAFGKTHGQPRATIVCLHGIQTHADWFSLLGEEAEKEGWLLLCPDRRGSGRSADGSHVARLEPITAGGEVWAEDLRPVFKAAAAKGAPVFLLGTSWGAKVALYATAERKALYPGLDLRGLILLVPATPAQKETCWNKVKISLGDWSTPGKPVPGLDAEEYVCKGAGCFAERAIWLSNNMNLDSGVRSGGRVLDAGQTPRLLHEGLRLEKLGLAGCERDPIPTVAVFASGDQIVAIERAPARLEKIAGKSVWLEGTGHAAQVEAPAKVAAAMRPFVNQHLHSGH